MTSQRVFHTRPLPDRKMDYPRTLNEFKTWLHLPGVRVQILEHSFSPATMTPQGILSVDNLGFTTADGVRRLFRSAKAWSFKEDRAILTISAETLHRRSPGVVVYILLNPN